MKTKLLLLSLTLLLTLSGFSQDPYMWVYGQVYNDQTNMGEANHAVYFMISDSSGGVVYDSIYTGSSGNYGDSLWPANNDVGYLQISTADPCSGNMIYETHFYAPPFPFDIVQDFLVCEQAPMNCENYFTYQATNDSATFVFNGFINIGYDTSYNWDFGDGSTGTGESITHTFPQIGINLFQVCLTTITTDTITGDTCMDTSCQDIYVGGGQPDCEAFYTGEEVSGSPLTWAFTDLSTGSNDMTWHWVFGDGTFSYAQNPVHSFPQAGTYEVCLTIIDSLNMCDDEYCEYIIVVDSTTVNCHNYFTYTSTGPLSFDFAGFFPDTSLMFPYHWEWNFGDGTTGFGQNITHTFTPGGTAYYNVCLTTWTIVNNDTCWHTSCQDVYVQNTSECIGGFVYIDSAQFVDIAYVHLMTYDSLGNSLLPIQTEIVNDSGYYLFDNVASGNGFTYYTQAVLDAQSVYFGQYMPTYHYDATIWSNASAVYPEPCPGNLGYDILMQYYNAAPAGAGNINGTAYNGTKKDVMADMEMLLYNTDMQAIGYVYTNDNGAFSFSDLAWGTYYISPEMVGIAHSTFMIVLDEDNPSAVISIIIEDGSALLSVGENNVLDIVGDLYPNPTKNTLNISLSAEYAVNANISVYNQLGQEMIQQQSTLTKGLNNIDINVSQLPESIYYLRLQVDNNKPLMRKFIKID